MGKRDREAYQQTLSSLRGARGGISRPADAFREQIAPVIAALEADGELTEPIRQMLIPTKLDQVHHIDGLDIVAPLYERNSTAQTDEMNEISPMGNTILNSMVIPLRAHQGMKDNHSVNTAVHQKLRELGLEQGAKGGTLHPLLQTIKESADAPFEVRKRLLNQYVKEIQPQMVEAIDDALTEYETRFAGDKMNSIIAEIQSGKY